MNHIHIHYIYIYIHIHKTQTHFATYSPFTLRAINQIYNSPYFDDVNAIIFMVALSAYDQPCEDDERLNRLMECMSLFNSIANHKLFELTSFILFLNKIDIFQRKLESGSMLVDHFPDYSGPNDYPNTTAYIQNLFLQQCKDTHKQVYTHFTHATVRLSLLLH